MNSQLSFLVVGSLNTDLFAFGIPRLPAAGGYEYGKMFRIAPGGKGRNIADMLSRLAPPNSVGLISKTVRDKAGLWKIPITSLTERRINASGVNVVSTRSKYSTSPVAVILVEQDGTNRIIAIPSSEPPISPKDISDRDLLFKKVSRNNGYIILSLELPDDVVKATAHRAMRHNVPLIVDPGGMKDPRAMKAILKSKSVFLIKPNEDETYMLTGIRVSNTARAKQAAKKLLQLGAKNVLITRGHKSALFASSDRTGVIPIPKIPLSKTAHRDETGCGDQTLAVLVYALSKGMPLMKACNFAILGGTLQFYREGVVPLTRADLAPFL